MQLSGYSLLVKKMGCSRKNPPPPPPPKDGILEILAGRGEGGGGGKRLWKSRQEMGLNFKKSSAGVISTDNSSTSNV